MSKSSPPAQSPKPYHFNKSTARANQAKSVAIRLTKPKPNAVASIASQNLSYTEFTISFTSHAQQALQRFIVLMDKLRSPKSIYYMTQSMEKVFGIWAHLTQTPAPGQLRPEKMKKLLREYGMKSAIANAMSQAPDPTPNASPIPSPDANPNSSPEKALPSESAIRNEPDKENDVSCLTHSGSNPLTDPPLPDAAGFQNQTEDSLTSQAGPVPTPDTPDPANGMAME